MSVESTGQALVLEPSNQCFPSSLLRFLSNVSMTDSWLGADSSTWVYNAGVLRNIYSAGDNWLSLIPCEGSSFSSSWFVECGIYL